MPGRIKMRRTQINFSEQDYGNAQCLPCNRHTTVQSIDGSPVSGRYREMQSITGTQRRAPACQQRERIAMVGLVDCQARESGRYQAAVAVYHIAGLTHIEPACTKLDAECR